MAEEERFLPVRVDSELRAMLGNNLEKVAEARRQAQANMILGKTPKYAVKYRKGRGGKEYPYVQHSYVEQQLNLAFGWKWSLNIHRYDIGQREVICHGSLTAWVDGVAITKSQFGGSDIKRYKKDVADRQTGEIEHRAGDTIDVGDDCKAAASDCLKKCASLLGIAADVYGEKEVLDAAFEGGDTKAGSEEF